MSDLAPALLLASRDALTRVADEVAAEAGHWAAFDNTGDGDFVCQCGFPWAIDEGCAFVRGMSALMAGLLASGEVRDPATLPDDEAIVAFISVATPPNVDTREVRSVLTALAFTLTEDPS